MAELISRRKVLASAASAIAAPYILTTRKAAAQGETHQMPALGVKVMWCRLINRWAVRAT